MPEDRKPQLVAQGLASAARPWWLATAALCVMGVAYGSLLPFHFHGSPATLFSLRVLQPPWKTGVPLDDLVVNFLVYLPLGFAVAQSARAFGRGWSTSVACAGLLCAAMSLMVENVQAAIPERVPSAADVVVNTLGGLCGAVLVGAGAMVLPTLRTRLREAVHERPVHVLGILVGCTLLLAQTVPFDFVRNSDELHASFRRARWQFPAVTDAHGAVNILADLPIAAWFGVWAGMVAVDRRLRGRSIGSAFGVAACETVSVVVLVEGSQLFLLSHVFESSAIVLRGIAAVLGAAVGVVHAERIRFAPWRARPAILVPTWAVLLLAAVDAAPHVQPLVSALPRMEWEGVSRLTLVLPFLTEWRGSLSTAAGRFVDDAIAMTALAIPLAILARRSGLRRPWLVAVLVIVALGSITTVAEAIRSSHGVDVTHPLLASLTVVGVSRLYPFLRTRLYHAMNRA